MSNKRLQLAHWIAKLFDTRLPYFKGAHQLQNVLTRYLAPTLHSPQRVSTRYGFDMMITTVNDSIDTYLYACGTYETGTLNIISKCLDEGDVFIDVGANIGLMSILGATRVGKTGVVYAFEPAPDTFRLLQENIFLNQMTNIHALNIGLGSETGVNAIYRNRQDNRGMSSFVERESDTVKGVEVPVRTLDRFLTEQDINTVRMVKIDVEGWEIEVLKGARNLLRSKNAPIISIEYNTSFPDHREIYNIITTINNYQIYILEHSNWYVSSLMRVNYRDLPSKGNPNLFCFLPVHIQKIDEKIFKD